MANLSPALKERFQRMQLVYHIRLMHRFDHILLGGFHIEEAVYGPLYYYPGGVASEIRQYEEEMPKNAILVHLTTSAEVIQKTYGGQILTSIPSLRKRIFRCFWIVSNKNSMRL